MRNKFSELIKDGVASFNYTPITSSLPDTDPICRYYNNVFSIPTDTHMSITDDGERIITGHMINTDKWEVFCCAQNWGAVVFKTAGVWSFCDFLHRNGLKGEKSILNNDVVYKISDISYDNEDSITCPCACCTSESQIPQPISVLTKSGNRMHIVECFDTNAEITARKMNESTWIKGCNWVPFENKIVGVVNESVYIINLD